MSLIQTQDPGTVQALIDKSFLSAGALQAAGVAMPKEEEEDPYKKCPTRNAVNFLY